jgi:hypothetical protein
MAQLSSDSYSLWLKPPVGPLYIKLEREISAQAKEHNGPPFEPHVTLLGGIEGEQQAVLGTAKTLADKLKVRNPVRRAVFVADCATTPIGLCLLA